MRTERTAIRDVAEGAVLVEYPEASEEQANRRAVATARLLTQRAPAGLLEAVPGARTLFVVFDPRRLARGRLAEELRRGDREMPGPAGSRRTLEVPVFYDAQAGPDLEETAHAAGLSSEEFARRHASGDYRVAFLGFAPGFPYLTGLPRELQAPRLTTPRTRVPAGSVGIGGPYTGIYPEETPGGWKLVGRAPVRLFDSERNPPALLRPGDSVRFRPIGRAEFDRRRVILERPDAGESRSLSGRPLFRVASPGALTSVQGRPRRGWAIYGVPPGGAMDLTSLAFGNGLLGNRFFAPALEMTLVGPDLEVLSDAAIAFSGGRLEATINGKPIAADSVCEVRAGDRIHVGQVREAARAYLCAAGGLAQADRPQPSRRLAPGDTIFLGTLSRAGSAASVSAPSAAGGAGEAVIRVLSGPQQERFEEGLATFLGNRYRVSASSDRRGIRLEGPAIASRQGPDIPPEGTALGAIQVPRDGQPIILGPDRPVTGGYAKIATVVEADFPIVARAMPGKDLRFRAVTLAEALSLSCRAGWRRREPG